MNAFELFLVNDCQENANVVSLWIEFCLYSLSQKLIQLNICSSKNK